MRQKLFNIRRFNVINSPSFGGFEPLVGPVKTTVLQTYRKTRLYSMSDSQFVRRRRVYIVHAVFRGVDRCTPAFTTRLLVIQDFSTRKQKSGVL